jgi:8-oxo-dGTP pyrophosphatase MutT (NUDIX family)
MNKKESGVARGASQVAVIPFHRGTDGVQVCLIRRRNSETWGIPKGFVDSGDSPREAALNEALEEAGLGGRVVGNVLGTYDYTKSGARMTVAVYLMEVVEEEKRWLEMSFRERRWYSVKEAARLLTRHPVHSLFDRASARLQRSA